MHLNIVPKFRCRGGDMTRLCASLLAAAVAGMVACQTVYAQPAEVKSSDAPKAAPATPAPAESAEAAPKSEPKFAQDLVDEALKKNRSPVVAALRQPTLTGAAQTMVDDYYRKYALPRWTLEKYASKIADWRKELRGEFMIAKGQGHEFLTALTLEYMNKLIAGNYPLPTKINAILAIGELNADEQLSAPVPLPAALPVLIAVADDAKLSDGLRNEAIVGIHRHATAGIEDEAMRRSVTDAMLRLVAAVDPPANAPAMPVDEGRQWLCRRAIDVLGRLGSVGQNNAVFNAVFKTLDDRKLSLYARSTAAEALGRLNYTGANGINALDAVESVGKFVVDVCKEELRLAETYPDTDVLLFRRYMKQHLMAASAALDGADAAHKGISPLVKDPEQRKFCDGLQSALKTKIEWIDEPKTIDDDVTPQVEELQKTLDPWLQKKPA
jgi:hypothetical protein